MEHMILAFRRYLLQQQDKIKLENPLSEYINYIELIRKTILDKDDSFNNYHYKKDYDELFNKLQELYKDPKNHNSLNLILLSICYLFDKEEYFTGTKFLKQAADLNDASAQFLLGLLFYNGSGVFRDRKMGMEYLTKAKYNKSKEAQIAFEKVEQLRKDPRFRKNTHKEIMEELENVFEDSYLFREDENTGEFVCYIRIPPFIEFTTSHPLIFDIKKLIWLLLEDNRIDVDLRRGEILDELDLMDEGSIARDDESSSRDFTDSQISMIETVRKKYRYILNDMGGVDGVINNFKDHLKAMYLKNPPVYKGKALPLEFDAELDAGSDNKEIRELYYTNSYHTAYRVFLKPNPWLDKTSEYAVWEPKSHESKELKETKESKESREEEDKYPSHVDISPDELKDLAFLWLAASDKTIKPIRDMTVETMMQHFVEEIALIGRGHNWDGTEMAFQDKKVQSEMTKAMIERWGRIVDDLGPDNPTCGSGVALRLMQSIIGNPISELPESRPLNPTIIRNHFHENITTLFIKFLSKKKESEIKALLEFYNKKYVELDALLPSESKLLNEFSLTKKNKKDMLKQMEKTYGDRFVWQEMQTDSEHYFSYEAYIRKLAAGNLWEQAVSERLVGIAKGRLLELEKASKALELHAFKNSKKRKGSSEADSLAPRYPKRNRTTHSEL